MTKRSLANVEHTQNLFSQASRQVILTTTSSRKISSSCPPQCSIQRINHAVLGSLRIRKFLLHPSNQSFPHRGHVRQDAPGKCNRRCPAFFAASAAQTPNHQPHQIPKIVSLLTQHLQGDFVSSFG